MSSLHSWNTGLSRFDLPEGVLADDIKLIAYGGHGDCVLPHVSDLFVISFSVDFPEGALADNVQPVAYGGHGDSALPHVSDLFVISFSVDFPEGVLAYDIKIVSYGSLATVPCHTSPVSLVGPASGDAVNTQPVSPP